MSKGAVITLPAFLRRARVAESEMVDVTPILPENDLEVLAKTIDVMRSRKVIADGNKIRATEAAEEAAEDLNAAVDAYESEVKRRGLLCRK